MKISSFITNKKHRSPPPNKKNIYKSRKRKRRKLKNTLHQQPVNTSCIIVQFVDTDVFQRDEMEANLRPTKTQLQTSKMVQVTVSKKQTSAGKTPQRDKGDTVLQSYREFSELGEEQTILNERIVVEAIFETINNKQTGNQMCTHPTLRIFNTKRYTAYPRPILECLYVPYGS